MASTSTTMENDEYKMTEMDDEIVNLLKIVEIILYILGSNEKSRVLRELESNLMDIDQSNDIAGVLMTVFTCLRQEINDPTGHLKCKSYTATIMDKDISIASIVDAVKERKIELNFMVATPIVDLMTLFKSCFDEVRTGVTRFKIRENVAKRSIKRDSQGKPIGRKDKSKEFTQNITQCGLNNHHIPLLEGITFGPERRTGVIRSLGPLAQAIMLVM